MKEIKFNTIDIKDPVESFQSRQSQLDPIDYRLLVNKPVENYLKLFINGTSGSSGDGTPREINLIGNNGDIAKSYSQEIVVGRGSTTATVTKIYTIEISGNDILIPAKSVIQIDCQPITSTQTIRLITTGGSFKYLKGSSLDLTATFNSIILLNESTSNATMTLNFATSGTDRPRFGIFMKVIY